MADPGPARVAYAADVHQVQISAQAAVAVDDAAPLAVRLVLLVVLLAVAATLGTVGLLGWRGRLTPNRWVGVRTASSMSDQDTFKVSNRVAGLPTLVGGIVALFGGIAAFGLDSAVGSVVAAVIGVVGAIIITAAGGVLGDRAAQAMVAAKPKVPGGCAGCACGGCEALTRG